LAAGSLVNTISFLLYTGTFVATGGGVSREGEAEADSDGEGDSDPALGVADAEAEGLVETGATDGEIETLGESDAEADGL